MATDAAKAAKRAALDSSLSTYLDDVAADDLAEFEDLGAQVSV